MKLFVESGGIRIFVYTEKRQKIEKVAFISVD